MAILRVYSGATGAGNGTSWTDAFTSLATCLASASCTDGTIVYVHKTHQEGYSGNMTLSCYAGTSSPKGVIVVSVDKDSSDAYVAMNGSTGYVDNSLNNFIGFGSGRLTFIGIWFSSGYYYNVSCLVECIECNFQFQRNSSANGFTLSGDNAVVRAERCGFQWDLNADNGFSLGYGGRLELFDCFATGSNTAQTQLIKSIATRGAQFLAVGCDFSTWLTSAASTYIVDDFPTNTSDGNASSIKMVDCKLPASYTLTQAHSYEGCNVELYNVGDGPLFHIQQFAGTAVSDINNYLNAVSGGGTAYSIKITNGSNALEAVHPTRVYLGEFYSPTANPTVRVELLWDSAATALDDDEFWIEGTYPDPSDPELSHFFTTRPDYNATPSALNPSSEVWTENLANDYEMKCTKAISGGGAGDHRVWACFAKPSATVYVDGAVALD